MVMQTSLADALAAWRQADAAWETRLALRSGVAEADGLLVLFRRQGERQPWVELAHQHRAPELRKALMQLGLSRRAWAGGPKAWGRTLSLDTDVADLERTLTRLWQAIGSGLPTVRLLAQQVQPPTNPGLLKAMRAAASQQDEVTRQALYAAIANASLLVPIDPATVDADPAEQQPHSFAEPHEELPAWGAFSDWDALRHWRPDGHAFGAVQGAEFLAHVHDKGRCHVQINPGGVVGGQLYPAEVEMMVDAVRAFYRRTLS